MGGKGSGGSNKKTIEQHLQSGTYRIDRHGALPKRLAAKYNISHNEKLTPKQSRKHTAAKPYLNKSQNKELYPIECPLWFDEYARAEFKRVCQVLYDMGTLQDVNHATLEGYCASYSRAVRAELALQNGFEDIIKLYTKTGDSYEVQKKKNAVSIAEKAWGQVKMFAVELGITTSKGKQEESEEKLSPLEKILREAETKPR